MLSEACLHHGHGFWGREKWTDLFRSGDRNRQCPGEMTPWQKYWLHRYENWSLDIQNPYEYWGGGGNSLLVVATLGKHETGIPRESWLEKPAVLVSSWLNQESLPQLIIWKIIKKDPPNINLRPLHACIPIHTYITLKVDDKVTSMLSINLDLDGREGKGLAPEDRNSGLLVKKWREGRGKVTVVTVVQAGVNSHPIASDSRNTSILFLLAPLVSM